MVRTIKASGKFIKKMNELGKEQTTKTKNALNKINIQAMERFLKINSKSPITFEGI